MDVVEENDQQKLPRKQKFKNLDEVLNEMNYDELPQQKKVETAVVTKDKKFRIR